VISTYPALLDYEIAWNVGPLEAAVPALFSSITARVLRPWDTSAGKQYELNQGEAGEWHPALDNRDGALDPTNPSSPYWPNVVPYRPARIRAVVGVNALTVDQATAGEGTGFLGAIPPRMHVVNDFGYPLTIVTSGSAYVGSQVYQAVLPSTAGADSTILMVQQVPVIPGGWYSFQGLAQITAGSTAPANAAILWFDLNGDALTPAGGTAETLTSGAGSWTDLTVSGQAPTNAYSASLKLEITAAVSAQTTVLVDALQWEGSQTPTSWQMPQALSQNLLPRAIATGTQSINPVSDEAANWFYPEAGSVGQATFLTAAPSGQTTACAWTTPAGTTSSEHLYAGVANALATASGPVQDIVPVTAGTEYTGSVYLLRAASADSTVQITLGWRWFDQYGDILAAPAGTAVTLSTSAWVRAACTGTAPTGAAWARPRIYITTPASTTAQNTVYSTGWQFEAAASASTWADPGVTKYVFTGFVEQYPLKWRLSQTWGEDDAVMVDVLGGLGVDLLLDPFVEECQALSPTFLYQLNDPAGVSTVVDVTGNCPAGVITAGPAGAGSLTMGSSVTSVIEGLEFIGGAGPVAEFANSPSTATQSALTYIALYAPSTTPNYGLDISLGAPAIEWTRMISFCATAVPAHPMYLWSATMSTAQSILPNEITFWIDASGHLNLTVVCETTFTQTYSSQSYCDGNWHLASISVDNVTGTSVTTSIDGVVTTSTASASVNACFMGRDVIGAFVQDPQPIANGGLSASVAFAVQFPFILTTAQIENLYGSWRTASSGESTGARTARILAWAGYPGATAIDTGATTDMGPATDTTGSSVLDALNLVATTENGNVYAASDGKITFKARTDRYNQVNPMFVFGEHIALGEWPYEDVQLPVDPVQTYNDVQVTQYSPYSQYNSFDVLGAEQVAYAYGKASQQDNFQRTLQQTVNVQNFAECQYAADYLLGQYQTPTMRAKALKLHPSAVPGLFAVCLALTEGTRIRTMKRPPWSDDVIEFDGFVERIEWSKPNPNDVYVTLECSPANRAEYWVLAALHTTLNAQASSGQDQITINALPDAALNELAASLPAGYQLVLDPGTAIAETVTLAPGGIPATTPGYTTATLTCTANLLYTHQPGATVCEVLPGGYTNPATWDSASVLGAAYTTFAVGASAGANTITVGPLADAGTNPLALDWLPGTLLSLSPGTADWEGYNLLTPNQATAGQGVYPLAVGASGSLVGIGGALGTPTVASSGSAFVGDQVWQVSVGASGTNGFRLAHVTIPAVPDQEYTWSVYVRSLTSGANPSLAAQALFLSQAQASLQTTNGTTSTLTGSSSATWTRVTVTATAPADTAWLVVGIPLTATGPSSAWTFQASGLQAEPNSSASTYQTCPQVLEVAPGPTNYTECIVTLANDLASNHSAGDWVCDQLPAGYSSPTAVPAMTRLAY
jgi:hypothetical protein